MPLIDTSGESHGIVAGASVQPFYVQRTMKVYAINEHEVQTLSSLNAQATVFFSLGSFFLSAALGIWTNAAFATEPSAMSQVANMFIAPGCLVVAVAFMILGWVAMRSRNSTWQTIKNESSNVG